MRPSIVVLACSLFLGGCTATDGTRQESPAPVTTTARTAAPPSTPQTGEFISNVDTIKAAGMTEAVVADSTLAEGEVRFSVQIGAFKDPANASGAQVRARDRYNLPVLNEFQGGPGLYRIRIGSFATREEALAALARMKAGFPAEYKASFILQLKR